MAHNPITVDLGNGWKLIAVVGPDVKAMALRPRTAPGMQVPPPLVLAFKLNDGSNQPIEIDPTSAHALLMMASMVNGQAGAK